MYIDHIQNMDSLGVTEVDICTSIPIYWVYEKSNLLHMSLWFQAKPICLLFFFIIYLNLWRNHIIIIHENY